MHQNRTVSLRAVATIAYLCRRLVSSGRSQFLGWPSGSLDLDFVAVERRERRSVTRRAVRRAERVALDRRRVGAIGWGGVRAGAQAYLGPRPGVGSRPVTGWLMGCCSRWAKRCGRSVFAGRPRERGGSDLSGAGRGASVLVRRPGAHEKSSLVRRARARRRRARGACGSCVSGVCA
jgi:hypothetical protein